MPALLEPQLRALIVWCARRWKGPAASPHATHAPAQPPQIRGEPSSGTPLILPAHARSSVGPPPWADSQQLQYASGVWYLASGIGIGITSVAARSACSLSMSCFHCMICPAANTLACMQAAAVYTDESLAEVGRGGVAAAHQHHGKEVGLPALSQPALDHRAWCHPMHVL